MRVHETVVASQLLPPRIANSALAVSPITGSAGMVGGFHSRNLTGGGGAVCDSRVTCFDTVGRLALRGSLAGEGFALRSFAESRGVKVYV